VQWTLPGEYRDTSPCLAFASGVLYFQGSPQIRPAPKPSGTLYALDLASHEILWAFTRSGKHSDWSFGYVTPVDSGLWVDSYQAMLKLQ